MLSASSTGNGVTVSGTAYPGTTIVIYANNSVVGYTYADASGAYSVTLALPEGETTLTARAIDSEGDKSEESNGVTLDVAGDNLTLKVKPGTVPLGPAQGLTMARLQELFDEAVARWRANGFVTVASGDLAGIAIELVDLPDGKLAQYTAGTILVDADAAGYGWYVDITPASDAEFARGAESFLLTARGDSDAVGRVDLLTVLMHELGHALDLGDASRFVSTRLMSETIGLGERRLISALDAPVLPAAVATLAAAGGVAVTTPLANGDFADAAGWTAVGGAVVTDGVGRLAEDDRVLTALRQGFAVPAGAESLIFTIVTAALGTTADMPPDAFEVALLDPVTGASLLGALGGLDLSDAMLNLQADGTLYLAPGVTISGDPLAGSATVTVSLAGVDTSQGVLLSFDLIGQGARDSIVTVDNIAFGGTINSPPVARDDDLTVVEDGSIAFDMRANDEDVDGDPLTVTIVTGPAAGTLTPPDMPDGQWTYTPGADFFGSDGFTYSISDGLNPPAVATVSITVTPVNDPPILAPVADRSSAEGDAVSIVLTASDVDHGADQLVFTLLSGPAGATLSPGGHFTWTAAGSGPQTVTVQVADAAGATAETSFTITVTAAGNVAPVLDPIADPSVDEGALLTIALTASDADHAADELVYSLISGPAGAAVSADGRFTWTATGDAAFQDVVVRVTDPAGGFDQASFRVAVTLAPANNAPSLAAIADQAAAAGQVLTLSLSGSDAEDEAGTLIYSLVAGPAGATVSADGGFRWQAGADAGEEMVTVRVTDSGGLSAERSFRIVVSAAPNRAPVLGTLADRTVDEGSMVSVQLTANDPDGPADALRWALVSAPEGAMLSETGLLTWFAVDGDAAADFRVRVTDAEGAAAEGGFTVTVADVAPTLIVEGEAAATAGSSYMVLLGASDPGDDAPIEWLIDWGDGTVPTRVAGDATAASHSFAAAGDFTVRATLINDDGRFTSVPLTVAVTAAPPAPSLRVTQAAIDDGALVVRFSAALAENASGRVVTLSGERFGLVAATIAYDADGRGFVLTRADGKPLQYDRYSLLIDDRGFVSADGALLDGDADGIDGGDYRSSILFARPAPGTAELPDFMRGPGEHVDVPLEDAAGLQVRFTSEGGVKTLTFRVTYDPALLRVDGVLRGADLPADATVEFRTEAAAGGKRVAIVSVVSDTPIAAGDRWLLSLDAEVPASAPYGASEILTVIVNSINAAPPSSTRTDEAMQLVGFLDDGQASPLLTSLWEAGRSAMGLPVLPSVAAERPEFDPIAYGTEAAVRKWAGDIHATASGKTRKAKELAAAKAKQAGRSEAAADKPATRGKQAEGAPAALLDFDAVPAALAQPVEAGEAPADTGLAELLAGPSGGFDLLPVMLPALLLDERARPRVKRRRKRS